MVSSRNRIYVKTSCRVVAALARRVRPQNLDMVRECAAALDGALRGIKGIVLDREEQETGYLAVLDRDFGGEGSRPGAGRRAYARSSDSGRRTRCNLPGTYMKHPWLISEVQLPKRWHPAGPGLKSTCVHVPATGLVGFDDCQPFAAWWPASNRHC